MNVKTKDFSESIKENLELAGCEDNTICSCLDCLKNDETAECLELLKKQRKELLNNVHEVEKKISYLDYLTDKIER